MSLAFRSFAQANTSSSVSSLAVNKPTGTAVGDLLVVAAGKGGTGAFNALSGFTERLNVAGASKRVAVWTRIADGSEASTFSPSAAAATSWNVVSLAYSGAAPLSFDAIAAQDLTAGSNTTSWANGGVTTAATNEMLIFLAFTGGFGNPATNAAPPSGFTERVDTSVSGNAISWQAIYVADALQAAVGASGTTTATGYFDKPYTALLAIAETGGGGGGGGSTFVPQVIAIS